MVHNQVILSVSSQDSTEVLTLFNPLTAGPDYIIFHFLSVH